MDSKDEKNRIIGLGKHSFKKSYYPELQKKLNELNVFKSIFEQSNESIIIFELDEGKILHINSAAKQFFNFDAIDLIDSISEIITPDYWDKVKVLLSNLNNDSKAIEFVYKVFINDEYFFIDNSISLIIQERTKLGSLVIRDITKSLNIQQQLVDEKEKAIAINKKTQGILNAIPDLMFVFNSEGVIIDYHSQKADDLYLRSENFINKDVYDVLPPNVAAITMQHIELVLATKETQQYNYTLKINGALESFDSRIVWVDKRTTLAMVRNITERVKMIKELNAAKEQAEESDKLKTAFLANMSHEIRTPMNGIVGFAQLLGNTNLTKTSQQSYISIINQSCDDLLHIISDILDISKIEAGQVIIRKSKFSPNALLQNLLSIYELKTKALQKSIEIKTTIPLNRKFEIDSDELRIKQVLINLLDNALKFTSCGIIEFGYTIKGEFFEFFISDTGCGIKKEETSIIFDRFRQSLESNEKNTSGTGLGLSISQGLIDLLGGKMWVESEINKGSTFKFSIPRDS